MDTQQYEIATKIYAKYYNQCGEHLIHIQNVNYNNNRETIFIDLIQTDFTITYPEWKEIKEEIERCISSWTRITEECENIRSMDFYQDLSFRNMDIVKINIKKEIDQWLPLCVKITLSKPYKRQTAISFDFIDWISIKTNISNIFNLCIKSHSF
jgi:hypothetical protein